MPLYIASCNCEIWHFHDRTTYLNGQNWITTRQNMRGKNRINWYYLLCMARSNTSLQTLLRAWKARCQQSSFTNHCLPYYLPLIDNCYCNKFYECGGTNKNIKRGMIHSACKKNLEGDNITACKVTMLHRFITFKASPCRRWRRWWRKVELA